MGMFGSVVFTKQYRPAPTFKQVPKRFHFQYELVFCPIRPPLEKYTLDAPDAPKQPWVFGSRSELRAGVREA
ncbi:hypothetical protein AB1N83_014133 [Pleurotus pulmonarius]